MEAQKYAQESEEHMSTTRSSTEQFGNDVQNDLVGGFFGTEPTFPSTVSTDSTWQQQEEPNDNDKDKATE